MKIKAIIFDLDGVLVDAAEWHYLALNRALGVFGFSVGREEHERFYNGLPTRVKLEHLTEKKHFPRQLHKLIHQLKQGYTQETIQALCTVDAEKVNMVRRLKEEGYRLIVCSNSVQKTVDLMLEKAGLMPYFDFFLSNENVARPKPDPEIFQRAFEKLQLKPSECLILEDAGHGKEAAHASGGAVLEVEGCEEVRYSLIQNFLSDHAT